MDKNDNITFAINPLGHLSRPLLLLSPCLLRPVGEVHSEADHHQGQVPLQSGDLPTVAWILQCICIGQHCKMHLSKL